MSERLPPSDEVREQEETDWVELLRESLAHAPDEPWEPPQLSRQGVVTLIHYIEGLRFAAKHPT